MAAIWRTIVWTIINVVLAEGVPISFLYTYGGQQAVVDYAGHSTLFVVAFAVFLAVLADALTSLPERAGMASKRGSRNAWLKLCVSTLSILFMGVALGTLAVLGLRDDYMIDDNKADIQEVITQAVISACCLSTCVCYKYSEWHEMFDGGGE